MIVDVTAKDGGSIDQTALKVRLEGMGYAIREPRNDDSVVADMAARALLNAEFPSDDSLKILARTYLRLQWRWDDLTATVKAALD